jgi:hypothetical protein
VELGPGDAITTTSYQMIRPTILCMKAHQYFDIDHTGTYKLG